MSWVLWVLAYCVVTGTGVSGPADHLVAVACALILAGAIVHIGENR